LTRASGNGRTQPSHGGNPGNVCGFLSAARPGPVPAGMALQESDTVKRTIYVTAGMLALSLAIVVSAQLRAQTTPATNTQPKVAAPTTKVAIMNLTYVVNNYDKFKTFKEEIKQAVEPFQKKDADHKAAGEKLAKEAALGTTTTARREEIENDLKKLQRQVEDNKNEAQKAVGKKQEQQLFILYSDVWNVVKRVAEVRGYEMVLHYNDTTDQKEMWGAQNIARKMQAGALMPIYHNPALDISKDVLDSLNAYAKSQSASTKH
jgi:Skp family chaperone for outer membrane proteins